MSIPLTESSAGRPIRTTRRKEPVYVQHGADDDDDVDLDEEDEDVESGEEDELVKAYRKDRPQKLSTTSSPTRLATATYRTILTATFPELEYFDMYSIAVTLLVDAVMIHSTSEDDSNDAFTSTIPNW